MSPSGPLWLGKDFKSHTEIEARFPLPKLTGHQFPLPVNRVRVDGRAFALASVNARPVLTGNENQSPVNLGSGNRA